MSLARTSIVECPKCGNKQSFTVWDTLNATQDPAKKADLLKHELTLFICESCGESHRLSYPILYNDPRADFMVWLTCDGKEPDLGDGFLTSIGHLVSPKKRLRHVGSYNELVEKIRIFDAGLDDHVVEWFKFFTTASNPNLAVGELFFYELRSIESRSDITMLHYSEIGCRILSYPRSLYDQVTESVAKIVKNDAPGLPQWLRVDRNYLKKNAGISTS